MKKEIKFETLGIPERRVLLTVLGYKLNKLKCQFCNEKVKYETCGIMPATDKRRLATITCSSPMCISEYLIKMEETK